MVADARSGIEYPPRAARHAALLAPATVALVSVLFVYNNLAGFFGLPALGPMNMYSGLRSTSDNHFLMPKIPLGDADLYVSVLRLSARGSETQALRDFRELVDAVNGENRLLHINVVRWQVDRSCASGPIGPLRLRLKPLNGEADDFADACDQPALRHYAILTSYYTCGPSGCYHLRRYLRDIGERSGAAP